MSDERKAETEAAAPLNKAKQAGREAIRYARERSTEPLNLSYLGSLLHSDPYDFDDSAEEGGGEGVQTVSVR